VEHRKDSSTDRQELSEKAKAILEGAMREFLAHGYAATSMDRVAAAAGVSKATVYSHFKDKEGLFNALIQRLVYERFGTIFGSLLDSHSAQAEPRVVLRRLATNMLDSVTTDGQLQAFMRLIVGESGRFPELANAYVRNLVKPVIDSLTHYLASQPQLKLSDPEAIVRIFIGSLIYHVLLQEVLHGKEILPMERERLVDNLISLIVCKED